MTALGAAFQPPARFVRSTGTDGDGLLPPRPAEAKQQSLRETTRICLNGMRIFPGTVARLNNGLSALGLRLTDIIISNR